MYKQNRKEGGTYHDIIPVRVAQQVVHARDGQLRHVGQQHTHLIAPTERTPYDPSWEDMTSWEPLNDADWFLDPNGDLYNDLVDADIFDENVTHVEEERTKKKHKKSRVSVSSEMNLYEYPSRPELIEMLTVYRKDCM